jgi:lactoylglutathione lyase
VSERPFRVLGIQQIAVGARDKQALRRFWVDLLGLTAKGSYRSEKENVDEDIAAAGDGALPRDRGQRSSPARACSW